jgi:membrane protease YdiL (CAAX protease family)
MPGAVGGWGWVHVVLFAVLLPALATASARRQRTRPWPPRVAVFRSVIVQQALFLAASLFVARRELVRLDLVPDRWWASVLAAALACGALVTALRPLWRRAVERHEPVARFTMPRTARERGLWLAVSVAAGVAEEVTYRGVLFVLLQRVTGAWWLAAAIAALAFGVGHSLQGARSIAIVAVIAGGMHGLVWLTGSLVAPILVHVVYDAIAGLACGRYAERYGYPADPAPAAGSG